ncbi:MAG: ABC transporter ATP-binding protein [Candidatus Aminicenantia bacterium]
MQEASSKRISPSGFKFPASILTVSHLKTYFFLKEGVLKAVNDVSFILNKNQTLAIVGESGSGKTVLSLSLIKLLPEKARIVQGEIWLNGMNISHFTPEEMAKIRGKRIAMIFQEPMTALNPVFTIGEQISETIRFHFHLNRKEAHHQMLSLLEKVRFPEPQKRYRSCPYQLSGGMRQRALIAIALSGRPDILIADEPTTALDVTVESQIIDLLLNLKEEMGLSLIFISHDFGLVSRIADRVGVMYAGQIVEIGKKDEIITHPKHPYTIALLKSLSSNWGERKKKVETIKGSVPNLFSLPSGCSFHPRCTQKKEICEREEPPIREINEQSIKCWLY